MPATFAAYVPVCTACFVNGQRSTTHTTTTGIGNPNAPQLSPQEMQQFTGAGIVALICLAGLAFLALTDRR
jgi:hypothetical protein